MATAESNYGIPPTKVKIKCKKDIIYYLVNRLIPNIFLSGIYICISLLLLCGIEYLNGGILEINYRVWFVSGVSLFQFLFVATICIVNVFKKSYFYLL